MEHLSVELAHRLVRGQLEPAAERQWNEHVRQCARCGRLIADERALRNVLDLDTAAEAAAAPDPDRVLDRVPVFQPALTARRRREIAFAAAAAVLVVGLVVLLGWQLAVGPPGRTALAAELGIPIELQNQVVASLSALDTLEQDPWLVEHYETVQMLAALVVDRPTEEP